MAPFAPGLNNSGCQTANLLQETLEEEEATDQALTELATSVINLEAEQEEEEGGTAQSQQGAVRTFINSVRPQDLVTSPQKMLEEQTRSFDVQEAHTPKLVTRRPR
jgi:hypothetical protein